MAPPHSAQPKVNRGTLSERQWQDIRRGALLSRETGVLLVVHGIKIFGDRPAAGTQPQVQSDAVPEPDEVQRPAAAPVTKVKKMTPRDARRAAENRARKALARWYSFARFLKYTRVVSPVATAYWRSRMSPRRDARRKLRSVFWREWTRPQFDVHREGSTVNLLPLGMFSYRDRFIMRRVDAFMDKAFGAPGPSNSEPDEMVFNTVAEDRDLQEAIAASLMTSPPETRGDTREHTATRSLTDAGITTPGSARRGKRRGGRS